MTAVSGRTATNSSSIIANYPKRRLCILTSLSILILCTLKNLHEPTIAPLNPIHHNSQEEHDVFFSEDELLRHDYTGAMQFLINRKKEYQKQNPQTWIIRGIGYLYEQHQLILAGGVVTDGNDNDNGRGNTDRNYNLILLDDSPSTINTAKVTIYNIYDQLVQKAHKSSNATTSPPPLSSFDCSKLVIWVRVDGPEIFSGKASHVDKSTTTSTCHWEFTFHPRIPGNYHVDSKVLLYDPIASTAPNNTTPHTCRSGSFDATGLRDSDNSTGDDNDNEQHDNNELIVDHGDGVGDFDNVDGDDDSEFKSIQNNRDITKAISSIPYHAGFIGFKMYGEDKMCCEICSRLVGGCRAWAYPVFAYPSGSLARRGCELFFDTGGDEGEHSVFFPVSKRINDELDPGTNEFGEELSTLTEDLFKTVDKMIESTGKNDEKNNDQNETSKTKRSNHRNERRLLTPEVIYGLPHSNSFTYFLGCGWSYWFTLDYPCLSGDLDDRVFFLDRTFLAMTKSSSSTMSSSSPLPTSKQMEEETQKAVRQVETKRKELPNCTISKEEKEAGRWVRQEFKNVTQSCRSIPMKQNQLPQPRMPLMEFDGEHPYCWHREDLTTFGNLCVEANCKFIEKSSRWISTLHEERDFFGRWEQDDCRYNELTDVVLQQCVDEKKLYGFLHVDGRSIAESMIPHVKERMKNIKLYERNMDNSDVGTKVSISTLELLHACDAAEIELRKRLESMNDVPEGEVSFWVSGYFLSSERELACTSARMERFNQLALEVLKPKGYKMINAFDLSAALTYDAAGQADGMHIHGPPMKMIMTKILHYICSTDLVHSS